MHVYPIDISEAPVIELPILGMLKDAPLHGYELKRRLETLVGYFGSASYGVPSTLCCASWRGAASCL